MAAEQWGMAVCFGLHPPSERPHCVVSLFFQSNKQRGRSTGGNTNSAKPTVLFCGYFLFFLFTLVAWSIDFLSEPAKAEL